MRSELRLSPPNMTLFQQTLGSLVCAVTRYWNRFIRCHYQVTFVLANEKHGAHFYTVNRCKSYNVSSDHGSLISLVFRGAKIRWPILIINYIFLLLLLSNLSTFDNIFAICPAINIERTHTW